MAADAQAVDCELAEPSRYRPGITVTDDLAGGAVSVQFLERELTFSLSHEEVRRLCRLVRATLPHVVGDL